VLCARWRVDLAVGGVYAAAGGGGCWSILSPCV